MTGVQTCALPISQFKSILGLIGLIKTIKAQDKKAFAIIALALNIIAIIIVFSSQKAYVAAIDNAVEGPQAVATSSSSSEAEENSATDLKIGESATLENGMVLTVDSVEPGKTFEFLDGTYTLVMVTMENKGADKLDYNAFSWHAVNADGVEKDIDFKIGRAHV